jgi:hypothetical protein
MVRSGIGDSERKGRRVRTFVANRLVALGWALKGSCESCAHRLVAVARWLVPDAQRYLARHIRRS